MVPYISEPYAESHPDLLAAIAGGFGLNPPPVDSARILELGCSAGNNLLPIAAFIPGTKCLGIDGSEQAIALGHKTISSVGLSNIQLRRVRFEEAGGLGEFDYVICHGVYSWITPAIRREVLNLIASNLAPNGIAYISFNTFPGWHQRMPVRELMRYHLNTSPPTTDARQEIAEARLIAAALADQTDRRDGIYRQTMNHASSQFTQMPDWYLFHDYLEEENNPVYFSEFAAETRSAGLKFIADVEQNEVSTPEFKAELERIDTITGATAPRSREEREQYFDFLVNRAFRRAVVCRADNPGLSAAAPGTFSRQLRYATTVPPNPAVDPLVRYQAQNGNEITNYLHESIEISPFAAQVIRRLDGTNSIAQIAAQIGAAGEGGEHSPENIFNEVTETIDLLVTLAVIPIGR